MITDVSGFYKTVAQSSSCLMHYLFVYSYALCHVNTFIMNLQCLGYLAGFSVSTPQYITSA